MVNHFAGNGKIVSKIGLTHTLKDLIHNSDMVPQEVYPNCFHLNNEQDMALFKNEFKVSKAVGVMKQLIEWSESPACGTEVLPMATVMRAFTGYLAFIK